MRQLQQDSGFSLIELTVVIVVVGILLTMAMQSVNVLVRDSRRTATEREMEMLAHAIVGRPDITTDGYRSDFGYVGDVGAFPPDLQALYENPGGYATWDGPYLPPRIAQDSNGFKLDEWGAPYTYTGGLTITSTGSGNFITRKIADDLDDYLCNTLNGNIEDVNGNPPGNIYTDSIAIKCTRPDGTGGLEISTYAPDSAGAFVLDSVPVGRHRLLIIYEPAADTLVRYATILPRHREPKTYRFAFAYFPDVESSGTGRKCELIVQSDRVPADLNDFPVLLTEQNLPAEMLDADGAHPALDGGYDIWFSADAVGSTRLPCRIISFVTHNDPAAADVEIWVRLPSIAGAANTPFWVWYNSGDTLLASESEPYGAQAVWDSNFVVIHHLSEDPTDPAPQYFDATANDNDGTAYGSMSSGNQKPGQIGGCMDFDGNNDYVRIPSNGVTVTQYDITMEGWIYLENPGGDQNLFQRGSNYALWEIRGGGTPYNVFNNGTWQKFNFGHNAAWFLNDWHYVACTYDGLMVKTYINGQPDRTYPYTSPLDPYRNNYDLGIGANAGWNTAYLNGRADEIRVSKSVRTPEWIEASFNTQSSPGTFIVPGTPETP